jgi:predicted esterase
MSTNNHHEEVNWWEMVSPPSIETKRRTVTEQKYLRYYYGIEADEPDVKLETAKEIFEKVSKCSDYHNENCSRTYQLNLSNDRFCVVHVPPSVQQQVNSGIVTDTRDIPVVFFFHGYMSTAWYCALAGTQWCKTADEHEFIVVFGQGQGEGFTDGPRREKWGSVGFGDYHFEIENPSSDFDYINEIFDQLSQSYPCIDPHRIYYSGYSNGGMFSCNVIIHYGKSRFASVCSMMGGLGGHKEENMMNPQDTKHPLPLLLISGETDPYLPACQKAKELFELVGCPVQLHVLEQIGHQYPPPNHHIEQFVWNFFNR